MKHRIEKRAASPSRAMRCGARGVAACSPGAFARASGSRHDNEGAGERRANPAPADREGHCREGRRS
jgi:hypothetical protein